MHASVRLRFTTEGCSLSCICKYCAPKIVAVFFEERASNACSAIHSGNCILHLTTNPDKFAAMNIDGSSLADSRGSSQKDAGRKSGHR